MPASDANCTLSSSAGLPSRSAGGCCGSCQAARLPAWTSLSATKLIPLRPGRDGHAVGRQGAFLRALCVSTNHNERGRRPASRVARNRPPPTAQQMVIAFEPADVLVALAHHEQIAALPTHIVARQRHNGVRVDRREPLNRPSSAVRSAGQEITRAQAVLEHEVRRTQRSPVAGCNCSASRSEYLAERAAEQGLQREEPANEVQVIAQSGQRVFTKLHGRATPHANQLMRHRSGSDAQRHATAVATVDLKARDESSIGEPFELALGARQRPSRPHPPMNLRGQRATRADQPLEQLAIAGLEPRRPSRRRRHKPAHPRRGVELEQLGVALRYLRFRNLTLPRRARGQLHCGRG